MELTIFNLPHPQPFLYISIYVQCLQQQITSTFNSRFPFITAEQRQRQFIIKNNVMILSSMLHGTGFSLRLLWRWSQPAHKNLIRETAGHKLILEHKSNHFSQNLCISHLSEVSVAVDVKFGKHALRSQNGVLSREVVLKRVICFWSWQLWTLLEGKFWGGHILGAWGNFVNYINQQWAPLFYLDLLP